MNRTILFTLGNRDLQLKKDGKILVEHTQWFTRNNDSEEYCIQTNNKEKSFYDITNELLKNYSQYQDYFSFPMIQKTLEHVGATPKETRLIFSTSAQQPHDVKDCYYVAKIAEKYFSEKNYQCSCCFFKCSPTDFRSLVKHFTSVFGKLNTEEILLSVSGGTPDMRAATYFAGMFKGFRYLTINARTGNIECESFLEQEKMVLQEIVEKMLQVYDYEGIRNLPVNDKVKNYCTEALELYNLSKGITDTGNYEKRAAQAIDLLIDNARICFIQGRYAEAIGRLFRIEESVWYLLFYRFLNNKNLVSDTGKVTWQDSEGICKKEKFEKLLKIDESKQSFLAHYFKELFEQAHGELRFKNFPNVPLRSGKNFYYYFFKSMSQNPYEKICSFFEKVNKNEIGEPFTEGSIINSIRNKSYLGHGFQGVTKQDIEQLCGDFDHFLKDLRNVLREEGIQVPENNYFQNFNQKIMFSLKE